MSLRELHCLKDEDMSSRELQEHNGVAGTLGMRQYQAEFGKDISAYVTHTFYADNDEEAIQVIESLCVEGLGDLVFTPSWETENSARVVSLQEISNDGGDYLMDGVPIEVNYSEIGMAFPEIYREFAKTCKKDAGPEEHMQALAKFLKGCEVLMESFTPEGTSVDKISVNMTGNFLESSEAPSI